MVIIVPSVQSHVITIMSPETQIVDNYSSKFRLSND